MKKYKNAEEIREAMLSAWLDEMSESERVELIRKALCEANGIEAGYISFDIRDGKIKEWSEAPQNYTPGWEEYQIILFTAGPNWDYELDREGEDKPCENLAIDIYENDTIYKEIKEKTKWELQPYLDLLKEE